jgi:GTP cyclohydrolase II
MGHIAGTLKREVSARIPTEEGQFQLIYYSNTLDDKEHLAIVKGEVTGKHDVLVRVHSECFTGDILGSKRCDCGHQLRRAMAMIGKAEAGVIIYLRQEGRGIGLLEKLHAYNLQDQGYDTVDANLLLGHEADERDYVIAAHILRDLGVQSIRLLTNNPDKLDSLREAGIPVTERVPLMGPVCAENARYLQTKAKRLNHLLCSDQIKAFLSSGGITGSPLWQKIGENLEQAGEHLRRTGRSYVTLAYAQSLDGSIAGRPGHPLALSCQQSQILTHALRAAHDGILVGIGTVLADNPRLNVRLASGSSPQPIVLDSRLRIPLYAELLRQNGKPWIATSHKAERDRQEILEKAGAHILRFPAGRDGWVDLSALLSTLGAQGIKSLMVEGGSQVITNFLSSRLVDQLIITVAPLIVGGLRVINQYAQEYPLSFPRLKEVYCQQVGGDLVLQGKPDWGGA